MKGLPMLEQIWEMILHLLQSLTKFIVPAVFGLAVLLTVLVFRQKLVRLILSIIKKITGRLRAASAIADSFEKPAVFFLTTLAVYFGIGIFFFTAGPVSYTHLDVYKRQVRILPRQIGSQPL